MEDDDPAWALPDLDAAISRCRSRNREGIRCILHILGEDVLSEAGANRSLQASRECLRAIASHNLNASISLKLTALGVLTDRGRCGERVAAIGNQAQSLGIRCELDMEGRDLVDATLSAARLCASPSVALQAYLDRTPADLGEVMNAGIGVRIVKGTYLGDTNNFFEIQRRFRALCTRCFDAGVRFSVGTHDPDLVSWITETHPDRRDAVEFGFLMGFADKTKQRMAREGWHIAEYIPYGAGRDAYVRRRERYLAALSRMGRRPLP